MIQNLQRSTLNLVALCFIMLIIQLFWSLNESTYWSIKYEAIDNKLEQKLKQVAIKSMNNIDNLYAKVDILNEKIKELKLEKDIDQLKKYMIENKTIL
jgi:hypothetical protein